MERQSQAGASAVQLRDPGCGEEGSGTPVSPQPVSVFPSW